MPAAFYIICVIDKHIIFHILFYLPQTYDGWGYTYHLTHIVNLKILFITKIIIACLYMAYWNLSIYSRVRKYIFIYRDNTFSFKTGLLILEKNYIIGSIRTVCVVNSKQKKYVIKDLRCSIQAFSYESS